MAIYLVEGKIGSGKTYWAVNALLKKYYHFDELLNDYLPKVHTAIITNIRGIRLDCIDLKTEIDQHGLERVFSSQYVSDLRSRLGVRYVVYVIDEIQTIFDRKYFNKSVFGFFQTCRHHGLDIFGITQDVESVAKELRILQEYTVKAVSRSSGSGVGFTYQYHQDGEKFKTQMLKKDKNVFRMYISQLQSETEKVRPVYFRYMVVAGLLVLLCVVSVMMFFKTLFMPPSANAVQKSPSQYQKELKTKNEKQEVRSSEKEKKEVPSIPVSVVPVSPSVSCESDRNACEKTCVELSSAKLIDGEKTYLYESFQCQDKIIDFREGKKIKVVRSK